jgi:HEAT repeat protein
MIKYSHKESKSGTPFILVGRTFYLVYNLVRLSLQLYCVTLNHCPLALGDDKIKVCMVISFIIGQGNINMAAFSEDLLKITDAEQPFALSTLYILSNLESEHQQEFEQRWLQTALERRRRVAGSLSELAEEDIELDFSSIFYFLLKDSDAQIRTNALEGLWEDESRKLLGLLLDLVERDPSELVREKAALSLGRFSYQAEVGKLPERWVTRLHETMLSLSADEQVPVAVRRRLVEALGYFSNSERVTKLIQQSYTSDDIDLQASALRAMGRNMDKRWLPEVGKEMSSTDPALRYEAATAAGEMNSDELLQPLIRLSSDKDSEVRLAAIWSLGQVGGPEAVRVLKELAHSSNEAVREAAQESLDEITFANSPLNVIRKP